ncbi:MAG: biosynthetic-type acetolactate synthase large subunit [Peptococcaceae bacterium]|jgi:acetolactate synthase-1/2/3 large subunit|nr:biosynthetic-type acetolactate synthase large subunit [Peptococcaceae bacterium]MDH7524708.1 biosynthetic-type acetolactate synthase large subunit [Peptococcaceae bacterium]
MNGAEYLVKFFENKNVDIIFGYPGGKVIFLYDVLARSSIKHILTRHEQGAVHAADGYARVTGRPGVCFATSGPGATNLVTGIANAYLDSVPLIAVTGQVGLSDIGRDSFQEADIIGITMPITKHSYMVKELEKLPAVMEEAWNVATTGRPGPVLVDIPSDIFSGSVDFSTVQKKIATRKVPLKNGLDEQLQKVVDALKNSKRPLLLAGGGIIASQAWDQLKDLKDYLQIPVVTTLMGKGAIPEKEEGVLGMVGMHGKPFANLALSSCDLLLGIGARFSDRITGKPEKFLPDTVIVHVDIDPAELCKNVRTEIPVVCDAGKFLTELLGRLKKEKVRLRLNEWHRQIAEWRQKYPLTYEKNGSLKPQSIIEEVARIVGDRAIVVTDVGQHQMFVAQYYPIGGIRNFVSSGGLGTMGFGLPAAIGAAFGRPGEIVLLFSGDGSIQMNIQELATLAQHQLPVKIFIMNNSCLGMVRQWQELFFGKRYAHTIFTSNPDFVGLAGAYGIKALRISRPEEIKGAVIQAVRTPGPVLVECAVDQEENVFPIIPPGGSPHEMLGRWQGETHVSRIG